MGNGKYYYIINPLKMMSGDGRHILRSELMGTGEFDGLIQGKYLGPCWVLVEINRLSLLSSTRFVVDWLYIHIGSLSIVTA